MPTFNITNDQGATVYQYTHDFKVVLDLFPEPEFTYSEVIEETPVEEMPNINNTTLTKLEYLRRFTQEERIAIRTAATQSAVLTDYLELLNLAEEIRLGDNDTIAAVNMLEQVGLIAAGRAEEILNG